MNRISGAFSFLKISSKLFACALFAAIAIIGAGCANDDNGQPGPFSSASSSDAAESAIASGAGARSAESFATGAPTGTMLSATVFVIAKYEASERQRRIVETRALSTAAHLRSQSAQAQISRAEKISKSNPAATTRAQAQQQLPRYLAVDTGRDARSSPRAKKSVMIWDTQAQQIVGKDVYDIAAPPPVGSSARFETYTAQYVGAGF